MIHEQLTGLEIGKLYRDRQHNFLVFDTDETAQKAAAHAYKYSRSAITDGWKDALYWRMLGYPASVIRANEFFMPVSIGLETVQVLSGTILGWMIKPDYWYNIEETPE